MKKRYEIHLQNEILLWFNTEFKPNEGIIFPVPNEGTYQNRNLVVLRGVSDLVVVLPGKVLFVELKHGNNTQTKLQDVFERRVVQLGYEYYICKSLEEFKTIVL